MMPDIGGPIIGAGALYGLAYSTVNNNITTYVNYSNTLTVTVGSLVNSLLVGDLYGPGIGLGVAGDNLSGGDGNDTIYGDTAPVGPYADANWATRSNADGTDYLYGNGGNDVLNGGSGYDYIYGGEDQDLIHMNNPGSGDLGGFAHGEAGRDTIWGGAGRESLIGGEGADLIYGGLGADFLVGESYGTGGSFSLDRADTLYGNDGDDSIWGGGGGDLVYGGDGNDDIQGGAITSNAETGRDTLYGQGGNDTIQGDEGTDYVYGGVGRDVLKGNEGVDWLYGGVGNDTLDTYYDDGTVDYFVFNTALNGTNNVDTITYWEHTLDNIVLDNDIFMALGAAFTANEFRAINTGTSFASVDGDDHIIYVKALGRIFYDSNGSDAGGRTLFAEVRQGEVVGFGDFVLIQ
jgi:Ca2+-binding RTX toxin-like protein